MHDVVEIAEGTTHVVFERDLGACTIETLVSDVATFVHDAINRGAPFATPIRLYSSDALGRGYTFGLRTEWAEA